MLVQEEKNKVKEQKLPLFSPENPEAMEKLQEVYANELARFLKEENGIFSIRKTKGVWHLSLTKADQHIKAKHKTFLTSVILLFKKNGFTFKG